MPTCAKGHIYLETDSFKNGMSNQDGLGSLFCSTGLLSFYLTPMIPPKHKDACTVKNASCGFLSVSTTSCFQDWLDPFWVSSQSVRPRPRLLWHNLSCSLLSLGQPLPPNRPSYSPSLSSLLSSCGWIWTLLRYTSGRVCEAVSGEAELREGSTYRECGHHTLGDREGHTLSIGTRVS